MPAAPDSGENDAVVPLCVEFEGALVRTNTFVESLVCLVQQNLFNVLRILLWRMRGTAVLAAEVARCVQPDVTTLPRNESLLSWLAQQREAGRKLVLCTTGDENVAMRFAEHHALFDGVVTLRGGDSPASRFGAGRYDFAGSRAEDRSVWLGARRAVLVDPSRRLQRLSKKLQVEQVISGDVGRSPLWFRALRLHQWAKNLLIFLPAAGAHQLLQRDTAVACVLAFVIFGVCASGTYLLNDLMDLEADRGHPRKRMRPFASGRLPLLQGLVVAPLLVVLSLLAAALMVGWLFFAVLVAYLIVTVWYSRSLKRIAMVDVLTLAGLYATRIIAGAAATAIVPSFWLLALTMFLFLSLAMAKRYSELKLMISQGRTHAAGRGYTVDDVPLVQTCGIAAGYVSVLVIALYVNSGVARQMYVTPEVLWLLCPLLLYWNSRVWLKTSRGQMHEDPVVFTLKDRPSLVVAALSVALVWTAVHGWALPHMHPVKPVAVADSIGHDDLAE